MEDNSGKLTTIIVFLCGILLFMAIIWITPNVYITRSYTSETTALTFDRTEVTVNWTAKYKAPIIFPREERESAEGKIQLYGEIRVHTLAMKNISIVLYNCTPTELQEKFNETDNIREIIKLFDNKIDYVKSIKINTVNFEIKEQKRFQPVDENNLTTLVTTFK
jgi:hypothetical protein